MSQALPLKDQLKALEHLQELDLKIDALKKQKSALPEQMKALEDIFSKVSSQVLLKRAAISEAEKLQRQTQAALELNRDRLTRSSSRLEGVQNSQEFQAANKEIEQLKKMGLSLEEQLKKSDSDLQAAQTELQTIETNEGKAKSDRDEKAGVVGGQTANLEGEIQKLLRERAPYASQVEPRILGVYDRVRGAKNGFGIAPAVGGRCSGCNMILPPQQFNEVQRGTQVQACPCCHRILFVPQASETKNLTG